MRPVSSARPRAWRRSPAAPLSATAASDRIGRYFADWVYDQVSSYVATSDRDLVVVTTLDLRVQRIAETELQRIIATEGPKRGVSQAALVMITPDGAIKAMVGGRDYQESEYNRAAQAMRQPGSAFKLFVFLAALEAGMAPDDHMVDGPIQLKNWRPGTIRANITAMSPCGRHSRARSTASPCSST